MVNPDHFDWRHWPPQGSGAVVVDPDGIDKAAAVEVLPITTEQVVGGIAAAYAEWCPSIPQGLEKTSALRPDGSPAQPVTSKSIWRHPDAHPLVLTVLLLDRFGEDYVEWEPDALRLTLQRDGLQTSNSVFTKILAARVVLNSPSPWRQWEVFHWVCLGLTGESPNFHYLEEPEPGVLAAGYDVMRVVDPRRKTDLGVDKFIAATWKNEGFPYIPPPLDFAQRELESPKIKCLNCGAIHRDDNDVRCVTCASPRLESVPYEFADLRDEIAKLWARRANLPLERAVEGLPETPAGSVVARLRLQWEYPLRMRARLVQQIRAVGG